MLQPTDGSNHIINMSLQTTLDGNTSFPSITPYPGITVPADGNWHQISVTAYTCRTAMTRVAASLYLQTVPGFGQRSGVVLHRRFPAHLCSAADDTDQHSIDLQDLSDFFPIGAAVDTTDLSGPHAQLLTMHFDSMTPGNDMKWSSVEPSLGSYNYGNGDAEVGEAVCANMRVRGQNLVWATGEQTPAYAFGDGTNSAANQALVTSNIQEHIQSEVQHYGSQGVCVGCGERTAGSDADGLPGPWAVLPGAGRELHRYRVQRSEAVCSRGNEAVYQRFQHYRSRHGWRAW